MNRIMFNMVFALLATAVVVGLLEFFSPTVVFKTQVVWPSVETETVNRTDKQDQWRLPCT